MGDETTLKIQKIRNGVVIDHIPSGRALKVLKILGIDEGVTSTVSVAIHVPSRKGGWKDIVKIEDRELSDEELNRIILVAPRATINIIRDYRVVEKHRVEVPETIEGIVKCINDMCVTNKREPVRTLFTVVSRDPLRIKCVYCESEMERDDIVENII